MILADAVRRFRMEQGFSLLEVSEMTGLSESALEWVERGAVVPDLPTFRKLARLLQWTPEEAALIAMDLPDASPRFNEPACDGAGRLQEGDGGKRREGWATRRLEPAVRVGADLGEGRAVDSDAEAVGQVL